MQRLRATLSHQSAPAVQGDLLAPDAHWRLELGLGVVGGWYVSTWAGMAYVCFVIDAYARRILGWGCVWCCWGAPLPR